jgi:anti-sigma regulatory factor (Ser/Thr protein kinase)
VLLTSEIVTNGVIHGDGVLQLRIEVADEAVRVEVPDAGSGCPVREDVPLEADRGAGSTSSHGWRRAGA